MAEETIETTLDLNPIPNEEGGNQDTIDLSGLDLDAIADLSDEDLEKAIAEVDAGEDKGGEGEGDESGGTRGEGLETPPIIPPKPEEHSEMLEKLQKQVADKENFIQERNRTIGDLRKQIETLMAFQEGKPPVPPRGDEEEDLVMKEAFFKDPIGTMERLILERDRRQQLRTSVLQSGIREEIPDIEIYKDDIADMALEDGWDRNAVETFRAKLTGDIPLLKAYVARVKLAKEFKALQAERDALQKKVEELPKAILKKIDGAAKKRTHMTASDGGSSSESVTLEEAQLLELSDEDLDRMLDKMGKNEH